MVEGAQIFGWSLNAAFGSLLLWNARQIFKRFDKLDTTVEKLEAKLDLHKDDVVKSYRRKEDCKKCEPVLTAITPELVQDLTSGVSKLNSDLATFTQDLEVIRNITGPMEAHAS